MARVLIVDDALMMRKTIRNFLQRGGQEVVDEAANGVQAVVLYKKHRPDLVTMDITMPESDGLDALAQIMAYDSQAKVIMVSSLGQKHKVFEALQKGARAYLLKPFSEDKLLATVKEMLQIPLDKSGGFCETSQLIDSLDNRLGEETAFAIQQNADVVSVTTLAEFSPEDFCELAKSVEGFWQENQKQFLFRYTQGNALQSKTVSGFSQIMEQLITRGATLRVECFAPDYIRFFRSSAVLQRVDWALIKKTAV